MPIMFDLRFSVIWHVVKDVDRKVKAVVIFLEFNGLKQ
jgi:hypothetical protein